MDPLHHDTSRPPEMVEVLRIRAGSRPGQIQQVLVVPVVLVVQELAINTRFLLQTAVEVRNDALTRWGRQLARVVLAVDTFGVDLVGMI